MKQLSKCIALLVTLAACGNVFGQSDLTGEPAGEAVPGEAPAPPEKQLAPSFNLPGTGDSRLRLDDAQQGPLAMFFYGEDESPSAFHIVGVCRDRLTEFEALRGQLCLVGTSSIENHEQLLERMPYERPLYVDKRGETQAALGLDRQYAGWAVISQEGEVVESGIFSGEDSESIYDAVAIVLGVLRTLIPADAPNFVTLLGEPLDQVRDLATLQDGRVVALTPDALIFILGDTNEVVEVEGGGLRSLTVDPAGLLYFSARDELRMFHETEGVVSVLEPGDENGTGIIECVSSHASAAIMFLRGGTVHAMMPASGRVVPLLDEDGGVDIAPTPDNSLLIMRRSPPYLQVLDMERRLVDLQPNDEITASPISGVVDPGGRIFVALREESEIHVLDSTGRLINTFPARGGGVDGKPLHLSTGAGYLDAAVRETGTRKIRILRFAL